MTNEARAIIPVNGRATGIHEGSLRDIFQILFRWRRTVIAAFAAGVALAVLITVLSPAEYRSDAKLLVRLGRESVILDPTAAVGEVVSIQQSRQNEINSELEILTSRELGEKLAEAIGPEKLSSPAILERVGLAAPRSATDRAVARLMDDLHIEVLKDSNIMTVSFRAASPELAQQVVAKLIDLYLDKHIAAYRTRGSYEFFEVETTGLRDSIARAEIKLRDIKNRANVGSIEEQRRLLLARIGSLQQEIQQNSTAQSGSGAKIRKLRNTLTTLPETVVTEQISGLPNAGADGMRQKLYELQLREQDILSKFREDSEPAQEVRRQIREAETLLLKEQRERIQVTHGLSSAHQKIKEDLLAEEAGVPALEARSASLSTELRASREELKTLNATEVDLGALQRQLDISRENYHKYSENLEQARIDQALETERISNISVIQPATLIKIPVSPRKGLNLALGLVLGIFGGVGLAFVREFLDHTIRRPVDVEKRLNVHSLVAIPHLPAEATQKALVQAPTQRLLGTGGLQPHGSERHDVLVPAGKADPYFEALRDFLAFSANGQFMAPCALAITSSRKGEGVTTVATRLALALRREREIRVALLDVRSLQFPGPDGRIAFSAYEARPDGVFVPLEPAGYRAQTTAELIAELKRDFAIVVLDTPAIMESSAAVRLCSKADAVVLVVKAEDTRWEVAQEAKESLRRANANVLGVVLNERRFHVPEWLYEKL